MKLPYCSWTTRSRGSSANSLGREMRRSKNEAAGRMRTVKGDVAIELAESSDRNSEAAVKAGVEGLELVATDANAVIAAAHGLVVVVGLLTRPAANDEDISISKLAINGNSELRERGDVGNLR